jgi:hypothetical protein
MRCGKCFEGREEGEGRRAKGERRKEKGERRKAKGERTCWPP